MYGLVLAGGGGKGGYHIGVWRALREMGITISAVTGTSVGALNGAFICQDKFEEAIELWSNISPEQVMETDGEFFNDFINFRIKLTRKNLDTYLKLADKHLKNKGISVVPLKKMINDNVDEEMMRKSDISFGLVTVSLTDRKPLELFIEDIPKGKLTEYLLASSFLPTFEPMELDGKKFIDGGFHDNLPINLMSKKGIKKIIAVELKAIGIKQSIKDKSLEIISISPSGDLGKLLEFDANKSRDNIEMGYLDALKAFKKVKGNLYYFSSFPEDKYFLDVLVNCKYDLIENMIEILSIDATANQRVLLELVMPAVAKLYGLDIESTYQDIIVEMIEYIASTLEVDRLKIYDYHQMIKVLVQNELDENSEYNFMDIFESIKILKKSIVMKSSKLQIAYLFIQHLGELIGYR